MTYEVVVLDPIGEERLGRMSALLPEGFALTSTASRNLPDQMDGIRRAHFAVTGDVPVTADMMREGAASRLIGVHKWGVGVDNIDCETARILGLRVMRTTGSNARAVAESAVALMLALQRSIVSGHQGLQRGEWLKGALGPRTFLLTGKTIGLVGLGHIGKNVAKLLSGFECTILYSKPTQLPSEEEAKLGVRYVPIAELIARSDIVSLHCALTEDTQALFGAEAFAAMKDDALLVNTARGGIVVEDALADALEGGTLRGAALDVFEIEPTPPGHRLLGAPNAIVTPHIASQAADNFGKTVSRMFDNIARVARGSEPPGLDTVV